MKKYKHAITPVGNHHWKTGCQEGIVDAIGTTHGLILGFCEQGNKIYGSTNSGNISTAAGGYTNFSVNTLHLQYEH
jgi:hypothetical protein